MKVLFYHGLIEGCIFFVFNVYVKSIQKQITRLVDHTKNAELHCELTCDVTLICYYLILIIPCIEVA